jgi:homocitrate synthase NifV
MKDKRFIVDTTLRDGEQSPYIAMNIRQKCDIAALLDEAGVYQIEAGIPAMGSCEIDAVREIMKNRKKAIISVWSRLNTDDIKMCGECEADIIHISVPVSYAQIYKKLNKNKAWVLKKLYACIGEAQRNNSEITIGFEDASRADMSFLIPLSVTLGELGIKRIRFADTVGVLTPVKCGELIGEFIEYSRIETEIHAHNDFGLATANSIMAAKAGAMYIDTTIFGIGERSGNCNLRELIHSSDRLFDWGVSALSAEILEQGYLSVMGKAPSL